MENYQFGEVLLLLYPFTDATDSKRRPVLLLLDTSDQDIVVARITSQMNYTDYDVEVVEWQPAGLLRPSVVRLHKVYTVEKRLIARRLGVLNPNDLRRVRETIHLIWSRI